MFAEDDCGEKENALAKEPPPLHPPPPCIVVRKTRENEIMNDDIIYNIHLVERAIVPAASQRVPS